MKCQEYDIVIVGAGITGLSLCYWILKEDPSKKILLSDKSLNFCSSRKNAGFLTSGSLSFFKQLFEEKGANVAQNIWSITKKNIELFEQFITDFNLTSEVEFRKTGSVTCFDKEEALKFEKLQNLYPDISNIKEVESEFFKNKRCFLDLNEGSFNPLKFHKAMMRIIKNLGAEINLNQPVNSYEWVEDFWNIHYDSIVVKAKYLFLATNDSTFLPEKIQITRQRAQIQTHQLSKEFDSQENFYLPSEKIYFRIIKDQLIIGGLRNKDKINEQTNELGLNLIIQDSLDEFVKNYIDPKSKRVFMNSGIMGFTHDHLPKIYIEKHLSFIGGFSGHGNGFSFYLTKSLVKNFFLNKLNCELDIFLIH